MMTNLGHLQTLRRMRDYVINTDFFSLIFHFKSITFNIDFTNHLLFDKVIDLVWLKDNSEKD